MVQNETAGLKVILIITSLIVIRFNYFNSKGLNLSFTAEVCNLF